MPGTSLWQRLASSGCILTNTGMAVAEVADAVARRVKLQMHGGLSGQDHLATAERSTSTAQGCPDPTEPPQSSSARSRRAGRVCPAHTHCFTVHRVHAWRHHIASQHASVHEHMQAGSWVPNKCTPTRSMTATHHGHIDGPSPSLARVQECCQVCIQRLGLVCQNGADHLQCRQSESQVVQGIPQFRRLPAARCRCNMQAVLGM